MGVRTQAMVVQQVGGPAVLIDIDLVDPQPNEVLVRITACGMSVESVGSAVTHVQKGDNVLLSYATCGECAYCAASQPAGCALFFERNFGRVRNAAVGDEPVARAAATGEPIYGTFFGQSAFARHAVVNESSVVKVPAGTDLVQLAPLGCGLQSGAGVLLNQLKPAQSDSVIIFGLGAVGFGALWAAAHLKLRTIIVVDLVSTRLELALRQGATHVFSGASASLLADIQAATDGIGAHYAIEATGVQRVLMTAWESIRNFGHCVSVGNPGPGIKAPFDINDHVNSSKTWSGLVEGASNPPVFIPQLMELHAAGSFPIETISKAYPVEQYDEALAAMKSGTLIKPILTF